MIRVAFASNDRTHVNLHFGGAESFVVYDVSPGQAELVGIGEFIRARQKGVNAEKAADAAEPPVEEPPVEEDKVVAKLEFLKGCAAVYAANIGTSSIKRLMAAQIQPIIVETGHDIEDLLNEVSLGLVHGGLSWVTRARTKAEATARSADLAAAQPPRETRKLLVSIDE